MLTAYACRKDGEPVLVALTRRSHFLAQNQLPPLPAFQFFDQIFQAKLFL